MGSDSKGTFSEELVFSPYHSTKKLDMSNDLRSLGNELGNYANVYTDFLDKSLVGNGYDENLHLPFITILIKNVDALTAISILLKNTPIQSVYFSVAAILRGCLLNSNIIFYLLNKMEAGKKDNKQFTLKKEIDRINVSQLKRFLKELAFREDDITPYLDFLNKEYDYFLETPLATKEDLKRPNFIYKEQHAAATYLVQESKFKQLSTDIFDEYAYYSKLEHLGIFTYDFYNRINTHPKTEIVRLKKSLKYIILTNKFASVFTKCDESLLKTMERHSDKMIQKLQS